MLAPLLLGSEELTNRLKALPYGLEETVSWGSLRILVRPLLAGLHWIHDHVVSNYGWAIVLMTVLIKLAAPAADPSQHEVDEEDAGAEPEDAGDPGRATGTKLQATSRGSRTSRCSAR